MKRFHGECDFKAKPILECSCTTNDPASNSVNSSFVRCLRDLTHFEVHGIGGRYASALYSAAYKVNKLDAVNNDLQSFKKVYLENPVLREFMQDPTRRPASKKDGIAAVLEKVKVSKEVSNLLILMAENGRLNKFEDVADSFETIMRAHRGEIFVQITSAEPLSKQHEKSLQEVLQKFVKPNQKLHVKLVVNPAIIGGIIVNIGDRYIDMSIASRVKKMEQILQSAI
ncbi:unnamed protein product [Enterobius vermicularis]|uniref:ATP synthase peripheral stalk subunit OSCP, mitochondrial n=1 Tax=Enterobius vermicularis TaxID=51028 RepID=A0A0N4VD75_ENTVE|nr:unnamed protein product [Enterobius vermicularis]